MRNFLVVRLRALALIVVLLCSLGFAADACASTARVAAASAATAPVAGAATPRAAMITYIVASRTGNLTKLCSVTNPQYDNVAYEPGFRGKGCVAEYRYAVKHDPKGWASQQEWARTTPLSLVDHAKLKIAGVQAALIWTPTKTNPKPTDDTFCLTRVSGRWLFDFTGFCGVAMRR